MKNQRLSQVAGVALLGSLALSGCGSDNNAAASTTSGGSSSSGANDVATSGCVKGTLNAEGSSAQKNAIDEVISSFGATCQGATINYNPTGSGAGIKQFNAGQVDFAGSDSALKTVAKDGKVEKAEADKRCGSPAWDLPMVTGPIAIAYHVKGVDTLVLNADVAARIFQGKITSWNDPAIKALNKNANLPATPVKVFFRSDESGTTENFTTYLSATAPTVWTAAPGKSWTGKGEGKEKSAGVSSAVSSTDGGITYAEWSYAKDNKLSVAKIDNGSGSPVELTGDSVGKAVAAARQSGQGNDLALKLDYATKEAGAYPILLVTYEIVCSKGKDANKTKLLKAFLKDFSSADTQKGLQDIGYAPLPEEVRTKVSSAIDAIQ